MAGRGGNNPRPAALAELLDHVFRTIDSASYGDTLNPAQWSALRFLNKTPSSGRNVKSYAAYHRVSGAAASKTMSSLLRKRLITKVRDPQDSRSVLLSLTTRGETQLEKDPLLALVNAFAALEPDDLNAAATALVQVARDVVEKKDAEPS
jgi:DNA-binding MarR family transcriptional regulator